jgi:hypothetical protein
VAAARAEAAAEAAAAARAAAGVVDVEAAADYSSLRVPELQAELRRRSLSPTGRKAELLDRLRQADVASAPAAPAAPTGDARRAPAGSAQQPSRHMLLPSDGAARLCDDESVAPRPPPAADIAASDAGDGGGDEDGDEDGDWAEPPGAVPAGDDSEDALLLAEGWLNTHMRLPRLE